MKLLIVGGTGSLSTAVVQEALSNNIEVYMINRGNRMEFVLQGAHLLKADINNKSLVMDLLKNLQFDAVIDFICLTPKQIEYNLNLFKNITGQYVFISSCIVYDIFKNNNMCDEDSPKVLSGWFTSVNKYLCENFLIKNAPLYGINYTIIRPATNYGNTVIPNGGVGGGNRLVLIDRIVAGKPVIVWNNGKNKINVIHVNDFAIGVIGILGNNMAYNEAFNIVGDETPSRYEILSTLSDLLGNELKTIDIPSDYIVREMTKRYDREEMINWDSVNATFSNQKIKSVVKHFNQNITLKDGLAQTLEYYQRKHYNKVEDYQFDGNYDRIIAKYTKQNNISIREYNVSYCCYPSKIKSREEKSYLFSYYIFRTIHPNILHYSILSLKILSRIVKKLAKLFKL
jgi:nucleoside-diphosphate-sugar epimerase